MAGKRTTEVEFKGRTYVIDHRVVDSEKEFTALWKAVSAHLKDLEQRFSESAAYNKNLRDQLEQHRPLTRGEKRRRDRYAKGM